MKGLHEQLTTFPCGSNGGHGLRNEEELWAELGVKEVELVSMRQHHRRQIANLEDSERMAHEQWLSTGEESDLSDRNAVLER